MNLEALITLQANGFAVPGALAISEPTSDGKYSLNTTDLMIAANMYADLTVNYGFETEVLSKTVESVQRRQIDLAQLITKMQENPQDPITQRQVQTVLNDYATALTTTFQGENGAIMYLQGFEDALDAQLNTIKAQKGIGTEMIAKAEGIQNGFRTAMYNQVSQIYGIPMERLLGIEYQKTG